MSYPCFFSVASNSVATSGAISLRTYTFTPARSTAAIFPRWPCGQPGPQPRLSALPAGRGGRGG